MSADGVFSADAGQIRADVQDLWYISDYARDALDQFVSEEAPRSHWMGHDDEYARRMKPVYRRNVELVESTGRAITEAIAMIVQATLSEARALQHSQDFAIDELNSLRDRTPLVEAGSGKR